MGVLERVWRIFLKILVIWANFVEFCDFDIDFKILKKSCHVCAHILEQILENFDFQIFEFWLDIKVMINDRGGILIFGQSLDFGKNGKFKSLTLAEIQILDP